MKQRRYRVLLLAEVANPDMVSVPLVAWSIAAALAKVADVHLVTHVRNRDAIAARGWQEGRDFTIIDTEWLVRGIFRTARLLGAGEERGWTIFQALAPLGCLAFERATWARFAGALRAGDYDLVHRLTPMSPTTPSILGPRLKAVGVPLVVGPLNGGLPWPPGFAERMHREREGLSRLRGLHRLLPGYRATRRDAAAFLAGSRHTLGEIPRYARPQSVYLPENGIDPTRFGKSRVRRAQAPLRGAFVGRLVPYKCADLLIRAAADLIRAGKLTLDIIGDGPDRAMLNALVADLGLDHGVTLHGTVAHARVQDLLVDCDFLACPSIREFGGGVVLEAMALGVAPIVADYGGPTELVDDDTGIRVPFSGPDDLVAGLRATLEALVRDPTRLDRIGTAAAARVAALFTWDRKAEQLLRVYDWVQAQGPRPDLLITPPADAPAPAEPAAPAAAMQG
ncbi:glycosyltransferase involved in cell wall biosynthesis [Sphingomonas prati]|uniref:Glycosyltransferase involved in cell wall biosynthesis n=1 Tax=Sphingomonas prati TaxID=1843237 RepID=A0A7W9BT89_9SPHN|nr:glycosyltransferase family 4 protein [Sphingomonas prati]MBB5729702.1 glycosyltransferase involved in cell wall biosynthesis [Sphingomonas prati]